jgi:hypothetical protein
MSDKPKPGSREAITAGCICAIMDNCHGQGFPVYVKGKLQIEPGFWIKHGCPAHDPIEGWLEEEDQREQF